jgi:hypothetical protein
MILLECKGFIKDAKRLGKYYMAKSDGGFASQQGEWK